MLNILKTKLTTDKFEVFYIKMFILKSTTLELLGPTKFKMAATANDYLQQTQIRLVRW